ncbi:MAG: DUF3313 domain-containing protein [Planctomycetota bacterium]|nr:DUF3313 domain-containing protein [Planctomycetota bacterium]
MTLVHGVGRPHDPAMRIAGIGLFLTLSTILGGCAGSRQARDVDLDGLGTTRTLTQGLELERSSDSDAALFVYRAKEAPKVRYTKLLLERVHIAKEGELDQKELANYQALADNAYVLVREALAQDFEVVDEPAADAFRLQIAILDASPASSVRRLLASASPVGRGLSLANYVVTGKPTAVGEITIEVLLTDSTTGTVLGAGVDRRVGTNNLREAIDVWQTANDALARWAEKLRDQLRLVRQARGAASAR